MISYVYVNPNIKRKGGGKKNLKIEEETLLAFGIILFLFLSRRCRRQRQERLKNSRRKEWLHPIFQQEARRVHGQYINLIREVNLVIGKIISGKYDLTFQIELELVTGQTKQ